MFYICVISVFLIKELVHFQSSHKMNKYIFKYIVLIFSLDYIEAGSFRCDYSYSNGKFFKYFTIPATWFDARLRCDREGARLASPSPKAKDIMLQLMDDYNPLNEIFTGISATVSKGDFFSVGGTPLHKLSLPWAKNEPDNKDNNEDCIVMNSNGEILDKSCTITRPYICYHPDDKKKKKQTARSENCGGIDTEYRWDTRTSRCYKFHSIPQTFSRAVFTCSAEGARIAVVNGQEQAKAIAELFVKYPKSSVAFVGFYSLDEHADWITINGQTLTEAGYDKFFNGTAEWKAPYRNIPMYGPDLPRLCGTISSSPEGLLRYAYCHSSNAFVCEKYPLEYYAKERNIIHKSSVVCE